MGTCDTGRDPRWSLAPYVPLTPAPPGLPPPPGPTSAHAHCAAVRPPAATTGAPLRGSDGGAAAAARAAQRRSCCPPPHGTRMVRVRARQRVTPTRPRTVAVAVVKSWISGQIRTDSGSASESPQIRVRARTRLSCAGRPHPALKFENSNFKHAKPVRRLARPPQPAIGPPPGPAPHGPADSTRGKVHR